MSFAKTLTRDEMRNKKLVLAEYIAMVIGEVVVGRNTRQNYGMKSMMMSLVTAVQVVGLSLLKMQSLVKVNRTIKIHYCSKSFLKLLLFYNDHLTR